MGNRIDSDTITGFLQKFDPELVREAVASYTQRGIDDGIKSELADIVELDKFLKTVGKLSLADMQLLVEQALILLEMFYVHMPLKRAMHAIDPIQRLRLLKYQLAQMTEKRKDERISLP